jgi:V/A-type H+-transporting ATPase subunit A
MEKTGKLLSILQTENELQEIVKLVGMDALSTEDRITLETARSIREDFLQQNAFDEGDAYTPAKKMYALMDLIFTFDKKMRDAAADGTDVEALAALPIRERIGRAKSVPYVSFDAECAIIKTRIDQEIAAARAAN